jgi:GNAT superfamily N-acetyltransferase
MVAGSSEQSISVRPSLLSDAAGMNALVVDRKLDITPGYDAYQADRIRWNRQHGAGSLRELVANAHLHPDSFFSRVAAVGEHVIGFANAEAPPDDVYCWLRGIVVDRAYEGQGVARRLEAQRMAWAKAVGRPVRGLIVPANWRSMTIFQRMGFRQVGTEGPTLELPIVFAVMEIQADEIRPHDA